MVALSPEGRTWKYSDSKTSQLNLSNFLEEYEKSCAGLLTSDVTELCSSRAVYRQASSKESTGGVQWKPPRWGLGVDCRPGSKKLGLGKAPYENLLLISSNSRLWNITERGREAHQF